MFRLRVLALVLTVVFAAACTPPPASQVPLATVDAAFFVELARGDVEFADPASAIHGGHSTCATLDALRTVPATVVALMEDHDYATASVIVLAAIHTYCPRHATLLINMPR